MLIFIHDFIGFFPGFFFPLDVFELWTEVTDKWLNWLGIVLEVFEEENSKIELMAWT